jgi:hypothetical protein
MGLPFCQPFDTPPFADFNVVGSSGFTLINDDSPTEVRCIQGTALEEVDIAGSGSYGVVGNDKNRLNIVTFDADVQTLYRRFSTEVKILPSQVEQQRAAIFLNYHATDCGPAYYGAVIDIRQKVFQIIYQNGANRAVLVSSPLHTGLANVWYLLSLSAKPSISGTAIDFQAILASVASPADTRTLTTSMTTLSWLEDSGRSGLLLDRTQGHFSYYRIEEI